MKRLTPKDNFCKIGELGKTERALSIFIPVKVSFCFRARLYGTVATRLKEATPTKFLAWCGRAKKKFLIKRVTPLGNLYYQANNLTSLGGLMPFRRRCHVKSTFEGGLLRIVSRLDNPETRHQHVAGGAGVA